MKSSETVKVKRELLKPSDFRHEKLSKSLINRCEILHELIFKPFWGSQDLKETIDDFRRDLYPENEIQVWEAILLVYLTYSRNNNITDYVFLKDIVVHLTFFSTGSVYDHAYLKTNQLMDLMNMLNEKLKELN